MPFNHDSINKSLIFHVCLIVSKKSLNSIGIKVQGYRRKIKQETQHLLSLKGIRRQEALFLIDFPGRHTI